MPFFTKDVFISYADSDKQAALRLHQILYEWLGEQAWIREFDLNGGDLIYNVLDSALTEAKWLIILLSRAAADSEWLRVEASIGTVRSLESEDFKIILVKLEECDCPRHFAVASGTRYTVDLSKELSKDDGFMRIADYVEKSGMTRSRRTVYEGRGADADKLSLVARRNRIIFVVGWRGIGKTAFVETSIEAVLRKRAFTITITPGYSTDLLARQVIQLAHVRQPIRNEPISDQELMEIAVSTLKDSSYQHFLLLDDAETALDGSNRLLPYMIAFFQAFLAAEIDTHIVVATTRNPDFPLEISRMADVFRLGTLADEYIREAIRQWLEGTPQGVDLLSNPEKTAQIINVVGGHPLAAKRMASFLKLKTFDQLLEATRRERFQLGFAEYILRATQDALEEVHLLILQILATIGEPIAQADLLAVKGLTAQHSLEDIHRALWELSDWFLIEQQGELVYLHSFLRTYYSLQVKNNNALRESIALDYGMHAYEKAINLEQQLLAQCTSNGKQEELSRLSNDLFRYALPADRLLRSVNKEALADTLPIRTRGVLRGMVYYFYQEAENYPKALEYAEKWLKTNPDDTDIKLYQIRCYRQLHDQASLQKARQLIAEMEAGDHSRRFAVRLLRERARVALADGDNETAKTSYRKAISLDRGSYQPYSEVYAGLARILIQEADDFPEWSTEHKNIAAEALDLLEIAKKEPDNFYRFHLDAYVEALAQVGDYDRAYPLLQDALEQRPEDGKLNFRMAESLRRAKDYEAAKHYAELSHKNNYPASLITYANILYDQGTELCSAQMHSDAIGLFNQALAKVRDYVNVHSGVQSSSNREVADAVSSKIYRALGDYEKAQNTVEKYAKSTNPYMVYEQSILYWLRAQREIAQSLPAAAISSLREASSIISAYRYKLTPPLEELLSTVSEMEQQLKANLGI